MRSEEEDGVGDKESMGVVGGWRSWSMAQKWRWQSSWATAECSRRRSTVLCEFVEMVGLIGAELVGLGAVHGGDDSARDDGRGIAARIQKGP